MIKTMEDSIFYKMSKGEIKPVTTVRYEDGELLAFDDLHPCAKVHVVLIPKTPVQSIAQMEEQHQALLGKMIYRAKLLADEMGLSKDGYRVTFNTGKWGGQAIPYLHLHLIGGEPLNEDLSKFSHGQ